MTRASHIRTAKVYLAQSRHFTGRARDFSFVLLGWVANQRRLAAQNHIIEQNKMVGQMELFA